MPANKYGDKPQDCLIKLFRRRSAMSNSDTSKTGDLKLKFRCCLYSGIEYFPSSPFNLPNSKFVLNENIGLMILFTKMPKAGFNVLYEPSREGVKSPW